MKRFIQFAVGIGMIIFTLWGLSHFAFAGGGGFDRLVFPGADAKNCGTWAVEGNFSGGDAYFTVTDGAGNIVAEGTMKSFKNSFGGQFNIPPKANPITFDAPILDSVSAINPCLPIAVQNPVITPAVSPAETPNCDFTPVVVFKREGLLTELEKSHLRERLIEPFYAARSRDNYLTMTIEVPTASGAPYLVDVVFRDGHYEGFMFGTRDGDYAPYTPETAGP
jgi:hypothetical protein